MNKFEYKNLTPFKWFVLENFPFIEADFDALTEWQLFCKLGKEINKIIDSQNVVGTEMEKFSQAFIELQNYVDNYFKNLDVQDEINNKLNEMAESGELECKIQNYIKLNSLITFNTVQDMKEATNIVEGSTVKTLGYYNINDGGNGTYKIRTITTEDVVDEGHIISINSTLIAELVDYQINIKQFGAKGDGLTNDSIAIQKAINYLTNIILNSDYATNNTIYIPGGKYKIQNQIILSPFIKLKTIGYAVFESYVSNDSTLFIKPDADYIDTIGNRQDWFRGPIIDGSSGLMFKYMGNKDTDNAICIEIGSRDNLGVGKGISRFSMREFRIWNFDTSILFNTYNTYCSEINRVHMEQNNIGVKYGNTTNLSNSGEKFTYNECIFAGCKKCIEWIASGFYSYFNNCNFDFNTCVFYTNNYQGDHFINVENGHIEAIGIDNNNSDTPSGIFDGTFADTSTFIINGNYIYPTKIDKLFKNKGNSNPFLIFTNNKFRFQLSDFGKDNYKLADENITIFEWKNNTFNLRTGKFANANMSLLKPALQYVNTGSQTINIPGVIGLWNITSKTNVSNNIEINNNNPFNPNDKTMKIFKADNSVSNWSINIQTKNPIPVEMFRFLICSAMLNKKPKDMKIRLVFLDKNGAETGRSDTTFNIGSDVDYGSNWWLSPYIKRAGIFKESTHVFMQVEYDLPDSETEIELGSMLLQYE